MEDAVTVRASSVLRRRRGVVGIHCLLALAFVTAVLLWAPGVATAAPLTVALLAALAVIADRHDIPLPSGIRFDALIALALISLALAGPRATLLVVYAPMLFNGLTGHERLTRAGNLANVAAYAAYTLVGAVALELLPMAPTAATALPWLVAIGVVLLGINWLVGPALYGSMWLGRPFSDLTRMLVDAIPAGGVMLALGAATIVASTSAGIWALACFALIAVLPQSALTFALRTRPVSRLDRAKARRAYAHALALQLRLTREERKHLMRVATQLESRPVTGEPLDFAVATSRNPGDTSVVAAHLVLEHWNGMGRPIGLRGPLIPLSSRVLAVADAWSRLTAAGDEELSHEAALDRLRALSGNELDPAIVRAARAVVAQERVTAEQPNPEPRLHRLRIPAPLRRALASAGA